MHLLIVHRMPRTVRDLRDIAPVAASYVRSEDAYKVPMVPREDDGASVPLVTHEHYALDGYEGPKTNMVINEEVLQSDAERYNELKKVLLRDSAIAGLIGAVVAQTVKGTEDAVCYAAGAAAGVAYLYFLSIQVCVVHLWCDGVCLETVFRVTHIRGYPF